MGFAEGVPASNQRDRFLVIHRHAAERLADIPRCSDWVRFSIGPFRIHVNQAHLNRAERIRELAVTAVAFVSPATCAQTPSKPHRLPIHPRARRQNRKS